ncbi:fimbrillin family protein [Prevotella sp.]|uniref:fimbrillin family protein n=1 Tax=Prevotella sp. TaxID=59823 RepID=UPI0025E65CC1|nr:fimbrillin family protein [Prevotella sp.]MCI6128994.1 fimbrillin family protein [Prevotella sp.]
MKKLFIMGLAAMGLALTACNSDETVEMAKGNAIGFKTFVNNSTRVATDATTSNLDAFKVWGLMNKDDKTGTPFVATEVTKKDGTWSYTPPVYWEKGYAYSFVALAPNDAYTFTPPTEINNWGSLTFNNGTGETDLIYATAKQTTVEGNTCPAAVNLTFNHMLSRVRFQFENGMDDGSVLTVSNVKITDAYTSGTATLAEQLTVNSWTPGQETGALEFGDAAAMDKNAKKETGHKYMIPATKDYKLSFTVSRLHHGVTDVYNHNDVLLQGLTFEPGKSYQLTAKFTAKNINPVEELCSITFTATVDPWVNAPDQKFNLK